MKITEHMHNSSMSLSTILGLPEIPAVPQGITDLIANTLFDLSTDYINRLIEVRVLGTRWSQTFKQVEGFRIIIN